MNKAFIFDMDGVIVNSEPVWEELERDHLPKMFGADVATQMTKLAGIGMAGVLNLAESLGASFDRDDVIAEYEKIAAEVYSRAPVTAGVDDLIQTLKTSGFRIGLVSQTREMFIRSVLEHLPSKNELEVVLSLHQHEELPPKPAPDGYLAALRTLNATPSASFILEDSNFGIQAGKAAGCFVIGYRGNLLDEYDQNGADTYADTMEEVAAIVKARATQP